MVDIIKMHEYKFQETMDGCWATDAWVTHVLEENMHIFSDSDS